MLSGSNVGDLMVDSMNELVIQSPKSIHLYMYNDLGHLQCVDARLDFLCWNHEILPLLPCWFSEYGVLHVLWETNSRSEKIKAKEVIPIKGKSPLLVSRGLTWQQQYATRNPSTKQVIGYLRKTLSCTVDVRKNEGASRLHEMQYAPFDHARYEQGDGAPLGLSFLIVIWRSGWSAAKGQRLVWRDNLQLSGVSHVFSETH